MLIVKPLMKRAAAVPRELTAPRRLDLSTPWSGMEEISDANAEAVMIEARKLYATDLAVASRELPAGGDPAFDDLPPHTRATYVKIAARQLQPAPAAL